MQFLYLELREEGTKCWRPVEAEPLGGELYRILGHRPSDEIWPYKTGDIVKCKMHAFNDGEGLLAYARTGE